jgi:transketolase
MMGIKPEDIDVLKIRQMAHNIRKRVLKHVLLNQGGYMSQACSSAELFAALYGGLMNLGKSEGPLMPARFADTPGPNNTAYRTGAAYNGPKSPELDRFFFSPAHYALVLYAVLIETGRLGEGALEYFNRDGYALEMIGAEHTPGSEVSCGSLPQAFSQAIGTALGRKMKKETGRVWVFMSDGEFQEGQTWEGLETIAHYQLDNLYIVVDVNQQQCDGEMKATMNLEPLAGKLKAFGAVVQAIDGHDVEQILDAAAAPHPRQALIMLGYTNPCQGLPLLEERRPNLHYLRFKEGEQERYAAFYNTMQS